MKCGMLLKIGSHGLQIRDNGGIELFPNPAEDYVTFEAFSLTGQDQSYLEFQIIDVKGVNQLQGLMPLELRQQLIDISRLQEGTYTLIVTVQGELVASGKFTVLR
jgi:hypothetical protein